MFLRVNVIFGLIFLILHLEKIAEGEDHANSVVVELYKMRTLVVSRSLRTTLKVDFYNPTNVAKLAPFSALLPSTALVTGFQFQRNDGNTSKAEIVGRNISTQVNECLCKDLLKTNNSEDGIFFSAGLMLEASSRVSVLLSYEDLLRRRLGVYRVRMKTHLPRYVIKEAEIVFTLREKRKLRDMKVTKLPGWICPSQVKGKHHGPMSHYISAKKKNQFGIYGEITISYTLKDTTMGEAQVEKGFFCYHFERKDFPHKRSHFTFVLGTPSLSKSKVMTFLRQSLSQLDERKDFYTILAFNGDVSLNVTAEHSKAMLNYYLKDVDSHKLGWPYNIDFAVKKALEVKPEAGMIHAILLICDGTLIEREKDPITTLSNARERNSQGASIHSVFIHSQNNQADMPKLLKNLAVQNGGTFRYVLNKAQEEEELKDFFGGIRSTLLNRIRFSFEEPKILKGTATRSSFHNYFQGSELVACVKTKEVGKMTPSLTVNAVGSEGDFAISIPGDQMPSLSEVELQTGVLSSFDRKKNVSRIWSYVSTKEAMEDLAAFSEPNEVKKVKKKIYTIGREYGYVSPMTTLLLPPGDDVSICRDGLEEQSFPKIIGEREAFEEGAELQQKCSSPSIYLEGSLVFGLLFLLHV